MLPSVIKRCHKGLSLINQRHLPSSLDLVSPAISLEITKVIYDHSLSLPLPMRSYELATFSMATAKTLDYNSNAPEQVKRHKKPWTRLRIKLKLFKSLTKKMKSNQIKTN